VNQVKTLSEENTFFIDSLVQMSSIIKNIRKNLKIQKFTYEGENSNWLLVSLKGILIQIFTEESREYYNIEDIYFDSETLYQFG
jgi:ribosomal silencing factor RsfS